MDCYTRDTIKLLLERDPVYLNEILSEIGIRVDLSKETPESLTILVGRRKIPTKLQHVSSIYACKCGSNNVVTREVQNRSADEGSTVIHICQDCGNRY
jgi:DNA-directed RNA polymerase subunit M/transcription elongation factor TFIIS